MALQPSIKSEASVRDGRDHLQCAQYEWHDNVVQPSDKCDKVRLLRSSTLFCTLTFCMIENTTIDNSENKCFRRRLRGGY